MFEHLIEGEYHPEVVANEPKLIQKLEKAHVSDIIDAKARTADWLAELGLDSKVEDEVQTTAARKAFATIATNQTPHNTKLALANLKTPAAVQHLVGMLSTYDWEFVERAKELRGYAVAQILEETKNPVGSIRLRALELLGKVTEVALFTERIEVKKNTLTDDELEIRIKEKLNKFMGVIDVVDVQDETEEVPALPNAAN